MKTSATRTAWSRRPPGLLRRSSTRPRSLPPGASRSSWESAVSTSRSTFSANCLMRTSRCPARACPRPRSGSCDLAHDGEAPRLLPALGAGAQRTGVPFLPRMRWTVVRRCRASAVIDAEDPIAGVEPGAGAGVPSMTDSTVRTLSRTVARTSHLDADAAELARGVALHLAVLRGTQERGVRIERLEHPLDGAVDQLIVFDLLDVAVLDVRQDAREDVELVVGAVFLGDRGGGAPDEGDTEKGREHRNNQDRSGRARPAHGSSLHVRAHGADPLC